MSLAFLGRREDAYFGPYFQLQLVRVHMMVGDKDKAVELSKAWLRVDPTHDPLRNHTDSKGEAPPRDPRGTDRAPGRVGRLAKVAFLATAH